MDYKEIYNDKEVKEKLLSGVNKLANTVLLTMGPNGKTVGIIDGDMTTKDGVTVAESITFKDPVENYAATLIKQVAKRTVDEAGDGTTTSICLAQVFINKGYKLMEEGISYNDIKENLELLEKDVINHLKKSSRKLTKKDVINVATISANNDKEIGKIIKKAYDHSKIVKVESSDNLIDSLDTITGMELNGHFFNKAFINNAEKQAIEYDKCKFLIIEGKLESIQTIKHEIVGDQEKPIVIMADHFTDEVVSILKSNYNRGALAIGLVKSPSYAQHRKDLISDIIKYTDAFNKLNSKLHVAEIDSLFADKDKLIISKSDPNTEHLEELKKAIENENNKQSKKLLQDRIDKLEGKLSIIKVGARSDVEAKERKDRIDDAVLAVRSAMEEGIVIGGGHSLALISCLIIENNYFKKCLYKPYEIIHNKKYTLHSSKNIDNSIIDPHKVTRCAFQNAISVAKTFLSMDAVVLNQYVWN